MTKRMREKMTNQPIEEVTVELPHNETAKEQPDKETAKEQPDKETAKGQPDKVTAKGQPERTTENIVAIVLAAGNGSRMKTKVLKQYLGLNGHPLIIYSLRAFEDSEVDDVILVVGEGEADYVRKEIVEPYGLHKVSQIVSGGKERYESVYLGLCAAVSCEAPADYVLIHDGARPFLTPEKISVCIRTVKETRACVMGMPVKDTIKIVDAKNFAVSTPDRSAVWQMQTPQCFALSEIHEAYQKMMDAGVTRMTDDAMVMEEYGDRQVKMIPGGYDNIKITTPEDMILGEAMMRMKDTQRSTVYG